MEEFLNGVMVLTGELPTHISSVIQVTACLIIVIEWKSQRTHRYTLQGGQKSGAVTR